MILLKGATIVSNRELVSNINVLLDKGIIIDITRDIPKADKVIDCQNHIVAAGYIDIHTHGGYLHDVMEGTRESIKEISRYHLNTGTTTFYPTTLTASTDSIIKAIDNTRAYMDENKYSRIGGIHLEGPFLSVENAGAQPHHYLAEPNEENTSYIIKNCDIVKRITIAPEVKDMIPYVKKFVDNGIQVSGGHDMAVDYEINPCIANGMNSVTHIFNCTSIASRRPLPHKYLGLTEIGLINNDLYVEVIGDNRHTPYPQFEIIYKMKAKDKIVLVSDSLSVAGMGNIKHYLGDKSEGNDIEVIDDVAILTKLNTYAGSVMPIGKMVEILINDYHMPIEEAVCMGNLNQAELMLLEDRGDIRKGMLADINILDKRGKIVSTIFDGRVIK